jgi:hypothetical protein
MVGKEGRKEGQDTEARKEVGKGGKEGSKYYIQNKPVWLKRNIGWLGRKEGRRE